MSASKEKKRKRPDAAQKPHKTVKITHLRSNGNELGPVVVSTPGLAAPKDITFNAYKKTGKDKELLLHSSDHPRLDYTAREEKSGNAESLLQHYIGMYNPETGELKVTPAHRVVLSAALRPSEEELKEAEAAKDKPTFAAQRKMLGMEFGTKKAKKMIASLTENAISRKSRPDGSRPTDALTEAVLDNLAETTANLATREQRQAAVDGAKPRPKPNLQATTPAEVYDLYNLIKEEDLNDMPIKEWQDATETGEDVKTLSRYVSNRLYELSSKKENVLRLKVLRYVYMLIQFYGALLPGKGGGKKLPQKSDLATKIEGGSDAIVDGMKRQFADGAMLTKWHVDKLILHILALTLLVDQFVTDTHDVREDLRLENRQISQYYSELGCKITAPNDSDRLLKMQGVSKAEAALRKMAKLKLPLEFPKERIAKAGKRR
ncbi:RNA polymerase I associated factor, A49-like protein [Tothia fuscella]|uniref:RNA polymerase I associated factor, A49-like protein n=1 Tax=Tothia fuscella TaxID=1048955 RepID=A0A9P4U2R6_9PEZI|nr:RNA polymerase I associated factor, A49-like protein [Tothia fuscella]